MSSHDLTDGSPPQRVGEVVESASHRFQAQCYQLYQAPPLGSLVSVGGPREDGEKSPVVFGVLTGIDTQGLEPGRPVIARGAEAQREEDIYRENPQLEHLLCTRFEAAVVGYESSGSFIHHLPPEPPRIHAFVHACTPRQVMEFTRSPGFLDLLMASGGGSQAVSDEVVASCLRLASIHHPDPRSFLVGSGKVLALLLASEPPRVNAMLRRLSP